MTPTRAYNLTVGIPLVAVAVVLMLSPRLLELGVALMVLGILSLVLAYLDVYPLTFSAPRPRVLRAVSYPHSLGADPMSTPYPPDAIQGLINSIDIFEARDMIVCTAVDAHVTHPQYDFENNPSHWSLERWHIARATKGIKTKLGIAFEAGDLLLYDVESQRVNDAGRIFVTAYSVRNSANTGIPLDLLATV